MTRPALRMRVQNHQIQNENELKLRMRTAMGKNKLKVNITSMVLPIKRRSSVGLGEKPAEKILIQARLAGTVQELTGLDLQKI